MYDKGLSFLPRDRPYGEPYELADHSTVYREQETLRVCAQRRE